MIKTVDNVIPNKLHQELLDKGIEIVSFKHNAEDGRYYIGAATIVFGEGTDMAAVQAVIDTHDPTSLP